MKKRKTKKARLGSSMRLNYKMGGADGRQCV